MNYQFLLTCSLILSLFLAPLIGAIQVSTAITGLAEGTALTQSPFKPEENNPLLANEVLAEGKIFLPLVVKKFPLIPNAPVLDAIGNTDGNGNYTVNWRSSEGADTYTLEEDENVSFSSPTTVFSGSGTSKDISGRDVGTYHYRVMASNAYASSDWSNIVSVEVTVLPPDCPQAGEWSGTTNQGGSILFNVEDSPQCQVTDLGIDSLNCFPPYDYFKVNSWVGWVFPIIENSFTTGIGYDQVTGDFNSITTADGGFSIQWIRFVPYYQTCQSTGTWTANP